MDIPKEEVTSKWNVLRAQFSREVHSELKLKSGAATSERYKSKWKFLEQRWFKQGKALITMLKKKKAVGQLKVETIPNKKLKGTRPKKKGHRSFEDGISHPSCSGL